MSFSAQMKKTKSSVGGYVKNKVSNVSDLINDLTYRIYFQSNKPPLFFYIPINPQTMRIQQDSDLQTANIVGLGEVVWSREPKLRKWSWEGLLMFDIFDPLNLLGITLPPGSYVKMIQALQASGKPFNFVYTSINNSMQFIKQTNCKALVESFSWEERGGEPGDIYYNITITEYREFGGVLSILSDDMLKELQETNPAAAANLAQNRNQVQSSSISLAQGDTVTVSGKAMSGPNGSLGSIDQTGAVGTITDIKNANNGDTYYRISYDSGSGNGKKAGWFKADSINLK